MNSDTQQYKQNIYVQAIIIHPCIPSYSCPRSPSISMDNKTKFLFTQHFALYEIPPSLLSISLIVHSTSSIQSFVLPHNHTPLIHSPPTPYPHLVFSDNLLLLPRHKPHLSKTRTLTITYPSSTPITASRPSHQTPPLPSSS